MILVGGVLPLGREVVGVFHGTKWLGFKTHVGRESYSCTDMQSVFSSAPGQLGHRTLVAGESYFYTDMQSVFSSAPGQLGHRTLLAGQSYFYTDMQSVFSSAPANWATEHSLLGSLISIQICSLCFLRPQPTGPQNTRCCGVLFLYRYAVGVFFSPNWLGYRTFFGDVLPLSIGTDSVFYTPIRLR